MAPDGLFKTLSITVAAIFMVLAMLRAASRRERAQVWADLPQRVVRGLNYQGRRRDR